MILDFPVIEKVHEVLNNHDVYLMPNGIYKTRNIVADNYLFPVYFLKEGENYVVSTSVYSLIHYKKNFVRNAKFQTTFFYRPTFRTIDEEINRVRTVYRRSTKELKDPQRIIQMGARLIQDYITEIEEKFPGYVHLVLMGGKDSQNLVLSKRKSPWIVLSGEPNAPLNKRFIEENDISIERFIGVPNTVDDAMLLEEVIASDCFYDVAHFRWFRLTRDLVREYQNKVVLWMGTSGDGVFARNNNHNFPDYFAVHDLHVGMSMGIWHQMYKNLFNIPVMSPYQAPKFLDELFYRFDPYFVDTAGDVRPRIGEILLGRKVKYPQTNPTPAPWWSRSRFRAIPLYVHQLKKEGVACKTKPISSLLAFLKEWVRLKFDLYTAKPKTKIGKVLFPVRRFLSRFIPALSLERADMANLEIR